MYSEDWGNLELVGRIEF